MRDRFRTLARTISLLAVVFMLVAGASLEALAQGRGRGRDNGRHYGWTRGRHRGWEHSRSRHVRDHGWWDDRRDRRRERRRARREWRRERRDDRRDFRRARRYHSADLNRDGYVSLYERRLLAARLRRGF